jgi:hypothetical protein
LPYLFNIYNTLQFKNIGRKKGMTKAKANLEEKAKQSTTKAKANLEEMAKQSMT